MTAQIKKRRQITPRQFERYEDKFQGYELIDGYPRKKAMGTMSAMLNVQCSRVVGNYVEAKHLGYSFGSECMYKCCSSKPKQVRKPDYSFIRLGRFADERLPKGMIEIPPDFMIEVLSPHESWLETGEKIDEFLEAGTPLIWVINPLARDVWIYRPNQPVIRAAENETISADPYISGFSVVVAALMPDKSLIFV